MIGFPWTLNLFAIYAFFWLKQEIQFFNFNSDVHKSPIESFGVWSYSMYLTHILAMLIFEKIVRNVNINFTLEWVLQMAFVLSFAYVFYLLFEKPFHSLARTIARYYVRRTELIQP